MMNTEVSWMTQIDTPLEDAAAERPVEETPFELVASLASFAIILLFIYTFLGQNFVIPSGSMENTLLVGDHLFVDRITLAPATSWMPLVHYREPRRNDIIVFRKPVLDDLNHDGNPEYLILVKRLIAVPGDRIHLHDGVVFINGVAQIQSHAQPTTPENRTEFLDEFPAVPPQPIPDATPEAWAIDFPTHLDNGDLVVPPDYYFMMGDNRHNSLDSRYWGFVPKGNIIGRPLFNYWSIESSEDRLQQTGIAPTLARFGHEALHFFSETRWSRTLHRVN
jgi:signal peptidase I